MAKFLTGKELVRTIDRIIGSATNKILIVSPFIKLDDYYKEILLKNHLSNSELHLIIIFGKNQDNPSKSLSSNDFEFFKKFHKVSIVYVPTLHAKYYGNETEGIITSMNLHDYSIKNNVEFGVLSESNSIGIGGDKFDSEAWQASMSLITKGKAVLIRRPTYKKTMLGLGKDFIGADTLVDFTEELIAMKEFPTVNVFSYQEEYLGNISSNSTHKSREAFYSEKSHQDNIKKVSEKFKNAESIPNASKVQSATQISKKLGMTTKEFNEKVTKLGLIKDNIITDAGKRRGLLLKNYLDKDYIAYPIDIVNEF